jgi:tetratricopeptide (TPR) repeat protein
LGILGRYDEAIECFNRAIELGPKNAEAWNNKGAALGKLGRYDEAMEHFDIAIGIDPQYSKLGTTKAKLSVVEISMSRR